MDELRQENQSLRQLVQEKERMYEGKIDEFIVSHKSLAGECKRLELLKEAAESENERLSLMLQDLEETQRRPHLQEDRLGKTGERASILKIKEQYAESLKQVRDTIHIQFENLFDNFRLALNRLDQRLLLLERRLRNAEEDLHRADPELALRTGRN